MIVASGTLVLPTGDQTQALGSERVESKPLDHQEIR